MKKLKSVFVDMDGVLVNTEPLHLEAWYDLLKEYKKSIPEYMNMEETFGIDDKLIAEKLHHDVFSELNTRDILSKKKNIMVKKLSTSNIPQIEGAKDFLMYIKQRNFTTVLVSSSSRTEIKLILKNTGFQKYIDFIVAGGDVPERKPAPYPYLRALEISTSRKEEVIVVEDSAAGIESAINVGLKVYGILSTYKEPPLEYSRILFFRNMYEFLEYFKNNYY